MIRVIFRGGMGNQMFQYAAGLDLALHHKTGLLLDATFLNDRLPRKEITFYRYNLGEFTLEPRFTALSKLSERWPIPGVWAGLDLFLSGASHALGINKLVRGDTAWDPASIGGNATLFGFFQGEQYFKEHEAAVRAAFSFKQRFASPGATAVSLHVRRGDYINLKANKELFGATDLAYYERAVAHIASRVKDPHFFIFSNDMPWCKENLRLEFPVTHVAPSTSDFQLMSLCAHNIIANSTFSWWAAWLNRNPQKIVVAPRQWYAQAHKGPDIVPEGWVKV